MTDRRKPAFRSFSRRGFLRGVAGIGAAHLLTRCTGSGGTPPDALLDAADWFTGEYRADASRRGEPLEGPVIFLAVDSLHPGYLDLDSNGNAGGGPGNWLMPRCREFLGQATWFRNASCYLPTATDMNHLNAVAATSSAQTGIISVFGQLTGWNSDGSARIDSLHWNLARDDQGRPVDTLFHAFKRRWPECRTAYVSGKSWVAEMYRTDPPLVDVIITGQAVPDGADAPTAPSLHDPFSDTDADCDPESIWQTDLVGDQLEKYPDMFPSDQWLVDRALELYAGTPPDFLYLILSQLDDAGHALGAAHDPSEFVKADPAFEVEGGCKNRDSYQWVSSRNPRLFREPILDSVREADAQVGRFLDGLAALGLLEKATIVLFSDHNMENHIAGPEWLPGYCDLTDFMGMLQAEGLAGDDDAIALSASTIANAYWREDRQRAVEARKFLASHKVKHPFTGVEECPWWVLDRDTMRNGLEGVCAPGELFHSWFVDVDGEKTMTWPDLIVLSRSGWQIPVYMDALTAFPIPVPFQVPKLAPFIGGHGSAETGSIVLGLRRPGGSGKEEATPVKIADLPATVAAMLGLAFESTTVGVDRRSLLG